MAELVVDPAPSSRLSRLWQSPAQLTLPITSSGISGGLWNLSVAQRLGSTVDQMRVIVNLAFLERHSFWSDGRQRRSSSSLLGALRIAPMHEQAFAEVRGEVFRFAQLYIPPRALLAIEVLPPTSIATSVFRDPGFDLSDPLVTEITVRLLEVGPDPAATPYRDHLYLALLSHLHREFGLSHQTLPPPGALDRRRLRTALEMLHDIHQAPTLASLSNEVGLSQFYFARSFRRTIGISPHAYLRAVRMDRAKRLLAATSESITQIALDCGYGTPSSFSTAFLRSTGLSPISFRKQHRR